MKKQIEIMIIFSIFLMLIPCISFLNKNEAANNLTATNEAVKILFTKENKTETISLKEYMVGAVMAQMPADFNEEALKAQAVLAHTYILRRRLSEQASPDNALQGAYISDDSSLFQSYFTPKQAKELYGDDYNSARDKIEKAVESVENEILTYDNEPIVVAFHAVSCGNTESSENMWGETIPYLISVDSSWDKDSESFENITTISCDEISARLSSSFPDSDLSDINQDALKIKDISENGTVLSLNINNSELSAIDFSNALSLPSPCFDIEYKDNSFIFKTKGYGHLVGMSQYGANCLANDKKTYDEILAYYFPKTTLKKIK